jgi:hypothetical protein
MNWNRREKISSRGTAPRMTADNNAILHFVDPIAELGDRKIVGDEQQGFASLFDDILQQLESAL